MEGAVGHDEALLVGLAEQGVCGRLISPDHGGSGLSLLDAAVAAEQLGAAATPYSYHSAGVMAPLAIELGANAEQRTRWLPKAAAGRSVLSFVADSVPVVAGKLSGSAFFVPDAGVADAFVVVCDGPDGRTAALVERVAPGLEILPLVTIDETRRVGELRFDGVAIDADRRLEALDAAAIDRIVDAGRIALAADALGASERSLQEAVAYSLERKQFGRVVGSFQAVKHMCAEMAADLEPARSLVWYAAHAFDTAPQEASLMATHAKAHLSEVGPKIVRTATEVHGGIGFTDELNLHYWYKRVGVDRQLLGAPDTLRERAAHLQGWV
jgi:alkylation response protein AidB-like acyl-CoA dehydrogenase